jgi:hypothetical protein
LQRALALRAHLIPSGSALRPCAGKPALPDVSTLGSFMLGWVQTPTVKRFPRLDIRAASTCRSGRHFSVVSRFWQLGQQVQVVRRRFSMEPIHFSSFTNHAKAADDLRSPLVHRPLALDLSISA